MPGAPREQVELDLRRLLELACDWYWTLDAELRLLQVEGRQLDDSPDALRMQAGRRPWEWHGLVVDEPAFLQMRLALEERQPFYELSCTTRDERGLHRYHVLSGEPVFDDGCFLGYLGTTRDLTHQKRSEALVRLEHAVTRSLAEAATSRKVMQAVMRVICESERWSTAGFFRVEGDDGSMRLVAGWNGPDLGSEAVEFYKQRTNQLIPPGGMLNRVHETGKPLWSRDLNHAPTTWSERLEASRERASFFCPVTLGNQVTGVFAFSSLEIREPDERLLATMRAIGEQVGQFLKRKEAEQVLRESEARFRALTDLSSDWYWEVGSDLCVTRVEGRAVDDGDLLPGRRSLGHPFWEIGFDVDGGWAAQRETFEARLAFRDFVMVQRFDDGRRRYVSISGEPMLDQHGAFLGFRGIARDVSERKEAELRIQHLATHDGLTGLPNRLLFGELLTHAIRLCERTQRSMAVLFVDLDRFKDINDTLGHDAGDALLKETGRRLGIGLRGSDVVARLGGDEFVVLVQQIDRIEDLADIASKLLEAASLPLAHREHTLRVTASIGISVFGVDAHDEHGLLRNADLAMYAVKQQGKNGFRFHPPGPASPPSSA